MIRRAIARALERGRFESKASLVAARLWAARAEVAREVVLPPGPAVIGIGGATLGGSHKTTLVLALASALRARGEAVAVVGHAYGARLRGARAVLAHDTARTVGDDAIWLARELAPAGVAVFAGARGEALALAAEQASFIVVDSLLQASPRRLALSLLAVDREEPWGSARCPPSGDLRAPVEALIDATDAVVAISPRGPSAGDAGVSCERLACATRRLTVFTVASDLEAAVRSNGAAVRLSELARQRVGIVLSIARPGRVLAALEQWGIRPVVTRLHADHAVPRDGSWRRRAPSVDVWLTTPKCATKLAAEFEGAPVVVVRQRLSLPESLLALCGQSRARVT